jgi:hypothetical protein
MENCQVATQEETDNRAAGAAKLACEKAYYFFCALRDDTDDKELQLNDGARYESQLQRHRARYEALRDEAVYSALAIKDEITQCWAIHEIIKLCRNTNELELAKRLFKEMTTLYGRALSRTLPSLQEKRKSAC